MKKIVCIGNALVDILFRIESDEVLKSLGLPKGSMQLVDLAASDELLKRLSTLQRSIASGGAAGNTARGLGKLGVPVSYIGKVQDDEFGMLYKSDMEKHGVQPRLLHGTQPTGRAIALISPDSERTFATCLGAAVEISENDLSAETLCDVSVLMIEGYLVFNHSLMLKAGETAKACGVKVALDMASYNVVEANREFLDDYIKKYVDIVFANEEEALALTGKREEEALMAIAEVSEIAVVKLGSRGSLVKRNGKMYKVESLKATSVDTTGAGDLYAAGFLYGLENGLSPDACGRAGSILAANVIEVIGTTMDDTRWKEIVKRVEELG
jgi:sugar/nucleoside kinase (ribokinase family)